MLRLRDRRCAGAGTVGTVPAPRTAHPCLLRRPPVRPAPPPGFPPRHLPGDVAGPEGSHAAHRRPTRSRDAAPGVPLGPVAGPEVRRARLRGGRGRGRLCLRGGERRLGGVGQRVVGERLGDVLCLARRVTRDDPQRPAVLAVIREREDPGDERVAPVERRLQRRGVRCDDRVGRAVEEADGAIDDVALRARERRRGRGTDRRCRRRPGGRPTSSLTSDGVSTAPSAATAAAGSASSAWSCARSMARSADRSLFAIRFGTPSCPRPAPRSPRSPIGPPSWPPSASAVVGRTSSKVLARAAAPAFRMLIKGLSLVGGTRSVEAVTHPGARTSGTCANKHPLQWMHGDRHLHLRRADLRRGHSRAAPRGPHRGDRARRHPRARRLRRRRAPSSRLRRAALRPSSSAPPPGARRTSGCPAR